MLRTAKSGEKKVGTGWVAAKAAKTVGRVRSGVDTVYWPAQQGRGRKIAVSIELQQRDNGKRSGEAGWAQQSSVKNFHKWTGGTKTMKPR